MQRIGRRIKSVRNDLGLSQKDLAARIGITHHRLSAIERGISKPDVLLFFAIAQALDVDLYYLGAEHNTKRPYGRNG